MMVSIPRFNKHTESYYKNIIISTLIDSKIEESGFGRDIFNLNYYDQDSCSPILEGRESSAFFVNFGNYKGVLKFYKRGGLISKINKNKYFWLGESRVRSFRELYILNILRSKGFNVPKVLGAIYWRESFFYKNAILLNRITGAKSLFHFITNIDLSYIVAKTIVRLHRIGIVHVDLNVFNIIIDDNGYIWIIDFDRAFYKKKLSYCDRYISIQRFKRSLIKHSGNNGKEFWNRFDFYYKNLWIL